VDGLTSRGKHRRSGFTLLEILLAIFILGVVLTSVYASYRSSLQVMRDMTGERDIYRMARIAMDRMMKDLSSLQPFKKEFFLQAERDALDGREFYVLRFWSAAHLDFEEKAIRQRPAMISYYVRKNEESETFSLLRDDVATAAPEPGRKERSGFVICEDLEALRFKFYDERGSETDVWDTASLSAAQKGKSPAAVKIEIELANKNNAESPYKFMTMIFLPAKK